MVRHGIKAPTSQTAISIRGVYNGPCSVCVFCKPDNGGGHPANRRDMSRRRIGRASHGMTKRARPSHGPCGLPGLLVAFAALSATATILPADASEGPTARLQEIAAAERAAEKRWQDAQRAKREYQRRSAAAHARMRTQGVDTMHASTPSPPNGAMCLAPGVEPAPFSPVSFVGSAGMGSVWSNADAATNSASTRTSPIRAAEAALGLSRPSRAAPWREGVSPSLAPEGRTPSSMHPLLDTHASTPLRERSVAFLPAASREPAPRGILRLANRDSRPTIVSITAFDDTGRRFGPIAVPVEAGHTAELSSSDIEQGNPVKGLPRGIGTGQGDWRLVLQSSAEIDVLAYTEGTEGLRTPLRSIAPAPDGFRHVPLFPAADGLLRLSNPGAEAVEARIRARDDAGRLSEVRATLPPGMSRWLAASSLESGQGVSGALGDGTGDWRLAIHAPAAIQALALSSSAGELGNLHPTRRRSSGPAPPLEGRHSAFPSADRRSPASCAPDGAQGKAECLPSRGPSVGLPGAEDAQTAWLPAATPGEALLRIANRSPSPGTATLHRAGGMPLEPLALRLEANAAVTLTASDLEFGNPAKGLAQGFGAASGNRRVTVRSQLELDVLSYVRSPSGLGSARHGAPGRPQPPRRADVPGRRRRRRRPPAPDQPKRRPGDGPHQGRGRRGAAQASPQRSPSPPAPPKPSPPPNSHGAPRNSTAGSARAAATGASASGRTPRWRSPASSPRQPADSPTSPPHPARHQPINASPAPSATSTATGWTTSSSATSTADGCTTP